MAALFVHIMLSLCEWDEMLNNAEHAWVNPTYVDTAYVQLQYIAEVTVIRLIGVEPGDSGGPQYFMGNQITPTI